MKTKRFLILGIITGIIISSFTLVSAKTSKTRDEAVNWANSRVGQKGYNMDAAYGAQCVDFIQEYYSFLGVSGGGGNAIDYASNTLPAGFTRIADYIGFVPEPGDIGIWYGNNGNPYGHVGIVLSANLSNVTVADVWGSEANLGHNWVGYDNNLVHKITRPYTYSDTFCQGAFWGVIRPDFGSGSASSVNAAAVSEGEYYIKNGNAYMSAYEDYNGGNVFTSQTFDASIQKYSVSKSGSGYKIQSKYNNTSRVVNVWTTDYSKHGDNVTLYDQTGHATQTWVFEKSGSGYIIHPADNMGLALTVQGNGNVAIENATGASGQIWTIENTAAAQVKKEESRPQESEAEKTPQQSEETVAVKKNNIKLDYEFIGSDDEAIGIRLSFSPSSNKYGYRIFRSEVSGEEGVSISDFAICDSEYIDVNVDSYTTYYYTIRPVSKEAKLNKKTGEMTGEKLGDISEETEITTPEIITENETQREFILMEIGSPDMMIGEEVYEIDPGRDTVPVVQNGRTLVPIRAIVEAMGGEVDWDGEEQMVSIEANGHSVSMWLGSKTIKVDGRRKSIDMAPTAINGRTMLPIRFVAENLGYQIEWIASTEQILIVF